MIHAEIKAEFFTDRLAFAERVRAADDEIVISPALIVREAECYRELEREAAYLYALAAFWYVADPLEFMDTSWKVGGVWRYSLGELVRAFEAQELRAWYVTPRDDPNGTEASDVVHAPTRGKAIMSSALISDYDYSFTDCRAVRLPGMDGKPVTEENLYTFGKLMVYCNGPACERFAGDENGGDPYFDEKGRAFCNDCWQGERRGLR